MKIIFFGTPEFALPTLEKLLSHPTYEVLGVVTQPDRRRSRGNKMTPSPVKVLALENSLTVWQPERIKKDTQTLNWLRDSKADAFVVIAYGQILSQEILDMPKYGCINVHGSILPAYRGAAPIQWSIYNGEGSIGITTMEMDVGMDTGAMLLKASTPIKLMDNAETVGARLAVIGADLLISTLEQLQKQQIRPEPQNNEQATYAPLIKKEDYKLNFSKTATQLHNQIRGFYPNCVASFRGQAIKITETIPIPKNTEDLPPQIQDVIDKMPKNFNSSAKPGEIVSIIKGVGPILNTGEGLLLLSEVQLTGKRPQSGWDFVNGMRLTTEEIFE